jgi:hypothetical protein
MKNKIIKDDLNNLPNKDKARILEDNKFLTDFINKLNDKFNSIIDKKCKK